MLALWALLAMVAVVLTSRRSPPPPPCPHEQGRGWDVEQGVVFDGASRNETKRVRHWPVLSLSRGFERGPGGVRRGLGGCIRTSDLAFLLLLLSACLPGFLIPPPPPFSITTSPPFPPPWVDRDQIRLPHPCSVVVLCTATSQRPPHGHMYIQTRLCGGQALIGARSAARRKKPYNMPLCFPLRGASLERAGPEASWGGGGTLGWAWARVVNNPNTPREKPQREGPISTRSSGSSIHSTMLAWAADTRAGGASAGPSSPDHYACTCLCAVECI